MAVLASLVDSPGLCAAEKSFPGTSQPWPWWDTRTLHAHTQDIPLLILPDYNLLMIIHILMKIHAVISTHNTLAVFLFETSPFLSGPFPIISPTGHEDMNGLLGRLFFPAGINTVPRKNTSRSTIENKKQRKY